MNAIRLFLIYFGVCLVCAGGFFLLYAGYTVMNAIEDPESLKIMSFVFKQVVGDDKIIHGTVGQETIEIYFSERMQKFVYSVLGLMILGLIVQVVSSLVSAGVKIIRAALRIENSERKDRQKREIY